MERITLFLQRRVKAALIVRLAAIAIVGTVALGSSGCQSFVDDWNKLFGYEKKPEDPNKSEFYVCNYWEDNNEDGLVSKSEMVGIKDRFRAHEKITLVAHTKEKKGYDLVAKVYNGKRKLIRKLSSPTNSTFKIIISFDGQISRIVFKPWQLHALGGVGDYTIEWYLNENRVGTNNFALID